VFFYADFDMQHLIATEIPQMGHNVPLEDNSSKQPKELNKCKIQGSC